MRIICFFLGHKDKWNNANPKCIRCGRPCEHSKFMAEHSKKKASFRFKW